MKIKDMLCTLPYEIFQLITVPLLSNKRDLAECCLVSTDWLVLFMQLLYQDIILRGPPSFQQFFTCLHSSFPKTKARYLYIRSLSVQDGNISQQQLQVLPTLCPKLEQLTIDGRADWYPSIPGQTWWPYLKQARILVTAMTPSLIQQTPVLTHLTVRCMSDNSLIQQLMDTLVSVPHLLSLALDECICSIHQLDTIHQCCPRLSQLELIHTMLLDDGLLPLSSGESPWSIDYHDILPSSSLRILRLQEVYFTDRHNEPAPWFVFFSQKYPQLEKVEWWHKSFHGLPLLASLHSDLAELVASRCQYLISIHLFNVTVHPSFYQTLLAMSSLEELGMSDSLDLRHNHDLRSLSLWFNGRGERPLDYVYHFPTQLVNLHLSGRMGYSPFDIHLILDHCIRLESLRLDFGNLSLTTPTGDQSKRHHPLKQLFMEEVNMTTAVINSIAQRCQQLNELDLLDCVFVEDDATVSNELTTMTTLAENNNGDNDVDDHNYVAVADNHANIYRMDNGAGMVSGGRHHAHLHFPYQRFLSVKLCGSRFSSNPSLRAKSVGIYEIAKPHPEERWYYLSHHATFLSYTPIHSCRYKLPVHAIKQHCIVKPSSKDHREQRQLIPPTELNALRQMLRQYGKFGRDPPCAGYVTFTAKFIYQLHLENRAIW